MKEFPEITRVFTRIGTSEIATDPMPPNESDVYIFYKPLAEWPKTPGRPTNKAELREQIEAMLKKINPDYNILFAQPIEMRFNEMLEGTKAELSVKIFGNDYDVLENRAEQIKGILEKTPGVAQVEFETEGRTPQLQIQINRDVLRRYGLQAAEVNKAVRAALAGQVVGMIVDGNRRYDIVVRMPEELRADDEQIKKLPVRVGETGLVPLGKLVEFKTLKTVEPIQRDDGQRRAALMVNLKVRDVEGFVREAERRIKEQVKLPDNYIIEFGGQFKNLQEARTRLAVVVPSALALIFVLIFFAFGSLRQALLVYSGIPSGGDRRRPRALAARDAVQHHGGGGIHRAERRGRAEWPRDDQLLQPAPRRGQIHPRFGHRRFADSLASGLDDRFGRQPWVRADGHCHGRGSRSATSARHRRHRRHPQFHVPDAGAASGAVRVGRREKSRKICNQTP